MADASGSGSGQQQQPLSEYLDEYAMCGLLDKMLTSAQTAADPTAAFAHHLQQQHLSQMGFLNHRGIGEIGRSVNTAVIVDVGDWGGAATAEARMEMAVATIGALRQRDCKVVLLCFSSSASPSSTASSSRYDEDPAAGRGGARTPPGEGSLTGFSQDADEEHGGSASAAAGAGTTQAAAMLMTQLRRERPVRVVTDTSLLMTPEIRDGPNTDILVVSTEAAVLSRGDLHPIVELSEVVVFEGLTSVVWVEQSELGATLAQACGEPFFSPGAVKEMQQLAAVTTGSCVVPAMTSAPVSAQLPVIASQSRCVVLGDCTSADIEEVLADGSTSSVPPPLTLSASQRRKDSVGPDATSATETTSSAARSSGCISMLEYLFDANCLDVVTNVFDVVLVGSRDASMAITALRQPKTSEQRKLLTEAVPFAVVRAAQALLQVAATKGVEVVSAVDFVVSKRTMSGKVKSDIVPATATKLPSKFFVVDVGPKTVELFKPIAAGAGSVTFCGNLSLGTCHTIPEIAAAAPQQQGAPKEAPRVYPLATVELFKATAQVPTSVAVGEMNSRAFFSLMGVKETAMMYKTKLHQQQQSNITTDGAGGRRGSGQASRMSVVPPTGTPQHAMNQLVPTTSTSSTSSSSSLALKHLSFVPLNIFVSLLAGAPLQGLLALTEHPVKVK